MLKSAKDEAELALNLDPLDSSAHHAMVLVQIQLDQTRVPSSDSCRRSNQIRETERLAIVAAAFFVSVGVQLKGLGRFRKRWEIRLSSRRIFPNLAFEFTLPAPATGIMPVFT